jgi:hypothetical protein
MELASTLAKKATKPNPFKIIPPPSTRKENNWKTQETLAGAVVTLETERIKGSNSWCLWWWWWWYYNILFLWDHCRICGPSLTETSVCGAYLYCRMKCDGLYACEDCGQRHPVVPFNHQQIHFTQTQHITPYDERIELCVVFVWTVFAGACEDLSIFQGNLPSLSSEYRPATHFSQRRKVKITSTPTGTRGSTEWKTWSCPVHAVKVHGWSWGVSPLAFNLAPDEDKQSTPRPGCFTSVGGTHCLLNRRLSRPLSRCGRFGYTLASPYQTAQHHIPEGSLHGHLR